MSKKPSQRKRTAEIFDAAADVFAGKGYPGASTKEIAERLGIQQAGVYYYFKSKEAALAEVCRIGVAGFLENLRAISQSDAPADEKIRQAVAGHLLPIGDRLNYVRVFQNERRHLTGANRKRVAELTNEYEQELRGLFEAGVREELFREDLDCRLATLALLGMCNGVATWYQRNPDKELSDIVSAYAEMALNGVKR